MMDKCKIIDERRGGRFVTLDALRGVAFIMIYFHHWYFKDAPEMINHVGFCVTFFYVLSGFGLCQGFGKRMADGKISYGSFMVNRLSKILPLNLGCVAFVVLFQRYNYGEDFLTNMIMQALMVQSWVPSYDTFFTGNVPSWFLTALIFFYVLFPVCYRLMIRHTKRFVSAVGAGWIMYVVAGLIFNDLPVEIYNYWFYVFPPFRLLQCLSGMALWYYLVNPDIPHASIKVRPWLMWAVSFLLYYIPAEFWDVLTPSFCSTFVCLLWALVMAWTAVVTEHSTNLIVRLFHTRPMIWLGSISFAAYLIHNIVIQYTIYEFDIRLGVSDPAWGIAFVGLIVSVTGAWLTTVLFVRPVSRLSEKVFGATRRDVTVL